MMQRTRGRGTMGEGKGEIAEEEKLCSKHKGGRQPTGS